MVGYVKRKISKVQKEITKEAEYLQEAARRRTIEYLLAAFGLVAGLAWNDAVKTLIEEIFPIAKNTIVVKFFYAIFITFVAVWISTYLTRITKGSQQDGEEKK